MRKICYVSSRQDTKMQRNHSCTSKMRKTPHFGQFSNDTLLFIYANLNKAEPREVTKQVVWIILRNRVFHGTIRHIRSGSPSYARTLCALTLPAYALKSVSKIKYITVIYLLCAHIILSSVNETNHVHTGYKRKAFLLWCRAGTRPFRYGLVKIDM